MPRVFKMGNSVNVSSALLAFEDEWDKRTI